MNPTRLQMPDFPAPEYNTVEPAKIYPVILKKVSNGFIIEVGCKTFVAVDLTDAFRGIAEYFDNPDAARKKYAGND